MHIKCVVLVILKSFCDWLTSLNAFQAHHVVECIRISFLFEAGKHPVVCICATPR